MFGSNIAIEKKKKNKLWIHEISAEGFTLSAEE